MPSDSVGHLEGNEDVWRVTGVTLTLGPQHFADDTLYIHRHMPRQTGPDDPELSLGMDAIRGRVLFVSYSARQTCLHAQRSKSLANSDNE